MPDLSDLDCGWMGVHFLMAVKSHQILWAVQLVGGGSTACYQGLEHAAHDHRLHALCYRLAVPCSKVVSKAGLVWEQRDRTYHSLH